MKRAILMFMVAAMAMLNVACDALHTISSSRVSSQGAPYELIVVCNQPEWEGEVGDTLRTILSADIPFLNQKEPMFNVLRVTAQGFLTSDLVAKHRNILKVVSTDKVVEPNIIVEYDLNAEPQIVVTAQAPNDSTLLELVSTNREQILQVLEMAERQRSIDFANNFSVKSLDELIKSKFGVDMRIPQGYTLRSEADDFLWISYERAKSSQGVLIYSYPATSSKESLQLTELLKARNKYTALIPGPRDGSYMTTADVVEPDYNAYRINGRLWVEMRGFWDVKNDYMGGPFVSYSTFDTTTNRIFTVDLYVYSPDLPKRNFLRDLEHLIYTVKMPETTR